MKPKKGLGLEEAPKGGRLRFIPPPSIYDSDPSHPPYLALRFDKIFRKPSHEIEILNAWDDLKAAGVKFPSLTNHGHRLPPFTWAFGSVIETSLIFPPIPVNRHH